MNDEQILRDFRRGFRIGVLTGYEPFHYYANGHLSRGLLAGREAYMAMAADHTDEAYRESWRCAAIPTERDAHSGSDAWLDGRDASHSAMAVELDRLATEAGAKELP